MRHVSSMTAIAALLVASSVGAADARQAKSYVHATTCGGHVMGSEAADASGNSDNYLQMHRSLDPRFVWRLGMDFESSAVSPS